MTVQVRHAERKQRRATCLATRDLERHPPTREQPESEDTHPQPRPPPSRLVAMPAGVHLARAASSEMSQAGHPVSAPAGEADASGEPWGARSASGIPTSKPSRRLPTPHRRACRGLRRRPSAWCSRKSCTPSGHRNLLSRSCGFLCSVEPTGEANQRRRSPSNCPPTRQSRAHNPKLRCGVQRSDFWGARSTARPWLSIDVQGEASGTEWDLFRTFRPPLPKSLCPAEWEEAHPEFVPRATSATHVGVSSLARAFGRMGHPTRDPAAVRPEATTSWRRGR